MDVRLMQHYYYVHTQQSSTIGSPIGPNEQVYHTCYCCARSHLIGGIHIEDTIPLMFGLYHRRWTTAHSSLILRFDSKGRYQFELGEDYSISIAQFSQTSSAYAGKTAGRVTRGASTSM